VSPEIPATATDVSARPTNSRLEWSILTTS
jgi:hypothetical protein